MSEAVSIADDFSPFPAGRFLSDGDFSGQAFREKLLVPKINELQEGETLTVSFEGVHGCGSSFIDEAFGGLVRGNVATPEELRRCLKLTVGNDHQHDDLVALAKECIEQTSAA